VVHGWAPPADLQGAVRSGFAQASGGVEIAYDQWGSTGDGLVGGGGPGSGGPDLTQALRPENFDPAVVSTAARFA